MGTGQRNSNRIMVDIYVCQNDALLQIGQADAINEDDFMTKCESLGQIQDLVPGFHRWFKRKRASLFFESAVLSARESAGVEGRFYTNGLELNHRLQKKKLVEGNMEKEVNSVNNMLQEWMEERKETNIRTLTERKLEQSKVWANIVLLKNIKLLLLIPQLRINGGRSAELKEFTYSVNTHHLLSTPTKS